MHWPYAVCRRIIDPRLWPLAIRQMRDVRVHAFTPAPDRESWTGSIEETVELTGLGLGLLTYTSALDVDVRFDAERSEVAYSLRPGGSPLLDLDDGRIAVRPLERGPHLFSTFVEVEKTVRFKADAPRWLVRRARDLPRMLTHWLHAAPREMGAPFFAPGG
jgi:hypothetical protein